MVSLVEAVGEITVDCEHYLCSVSLEVEAESESVITIERASRGEILALARRAMIKNYECV